VAATSAPGSDHGDIADAIRECTRRLAERGLEVLVLDQTRPDIGVPVVRVVVPGLRHIRPRLAPGRLYDVPVSLGWRSTPLQETALNDLPFLF
jgi:ribosomal protein S12 methylthiotransferase accessory factor